MLWNPLEDPVMSLSLLDGRLRGALNAEVQYSAQQQKRKKEKGKRGERKITRS